MAAKIIVNFYISHMVLMRGGLIGLTVKSKTAHGYAKKKKKKNIKNFPTTGGVKQFGNFPTFKNFPKSGWGRGLQ